MDACSLNGRLASLEVTDLVGLVLEGIDQAKCDGLVIFHDKNSS